AKSREFIDAYRLAPLAGEAAWNAISHPYMLWVWAVIVPALAWRYGGQTMQQRLLRPAQLALAVLGIYGALWLTHHFIVQTLSDTIVMKDDSRLVGRVTNDSGDRLTIAIT